MIKLPPVTPRDVARELARKYSTMTHEELDVLENILEPMKYAKGDMILREGEICEHIYYIERGLVRQYYHKHGKLENLKKDNPQRYSELFEAKFGHKPNL